LETSPYGRNLGGKKRRGKGEETLLRRGVNPGGGGQGYVSFLKEERGSTGDQSVGLPSWKRTKKQKEKTIDLKN